MWLRPGSTATHALHFNAACIIYAMRMCSIIASCYMLQRSILLFIAQDQNIPNISIQIYIVTMIP